VPWMRLREEGASVTVVGIRAGEKYAGKTDLPAHADVGCEEARADDYDAAVVPGGGAPAKLRRFDGVGRPVREAHLSGKTVGMICHAPLVGISAGIVRGHAAVGSEGIKDDWVNGRTAW
jgi:protease I